MGFIAKEIAIGSFISVLVTALGLYIYLHYIADVGFYKTLIQIKERKIIGAVLVLAAIPNLLLFWVFLKKKQDYRARGVLLVTFLTAITTTIFKFL